jgi:hypothetical protein
MPEAVTNLDRRMLLSGLVVNCRLIILWLWSRGRSAARSRTGGRRGSLIASARRARLKSRLAQEEAVGFRSTSAASALADGDREPGQTLSKKAVLESPRPEAREVMVNVPGTSPRAMPNSPIELLRRPWHQQSLDI